MDAFTQRIIAQNTHGEIRELLEESSRAYHNGRESKLTDAQYDYLSQYIADDMKVGALPEGSKVTLPIHMGSMDKVKSDSTEFMSFLREYTHTKCISEKLDGISLLIDASKRPVRAYTRGNGDIGQDVSHILPYIRGLPSFKTLNVNGYVRGEAIVSRKEWMKISHKGKNARNYVSGVMNTKEPNKDDIKSIQFVAYEFIPAPVPNEIMTPSVQFKYLSKSGFDVVRHLVVPHKKVTSATMLALLEEWKQTSDFEIDGIIIANDAGYRLVESGNPKHARAFKHNVIENAAETTVIGVEWNVSKDGKWKPVVLVEPIELEGVSVQRATGYNARFIEENGIGIGAVVRILRSGGVIPKIVEIVSKSSEILLPDEAEWDDNHTELVAISTSSSNKVASKPAKNDKSDVNENNQIRMSTQQMIDAKRIEHFITQCGIEFYKEKMIQRGIIAGVINNYHDLLNAKVETFLKIEGIKDKMAEKIYESVQSKIKEVPLYTFASALSIFPNIGAKKLKELFTFSNGQVIRIYQDVLSNRASWNYLQDCIGAVDGFSDKSTRVIVENFEILFIELQYIIDKYPSSNVAKMLKRYIENQADSNPSSPRGSISETPESVEKVSGKTIVFTGFRDKSLEERLEKMGARIGTRIRADSILVTRDTRSQTTKTREAQLLNCPIYLPAEFVEHVFGASEVEKYVKS
jgi:NAD-dependent DNA ligase